jgi:hypothetical protein
MECKKLCKYWDYFRLYWQKTDKWQTRPLVREGASKWQDFQKKISLVKSPGLVSTPRLTDWLTVSCKVTLTLTDWLTETRQKEEVFGVSLCHASETRKAFGAAVVARPSWSSSCDCCVRVSGVAHVQNWLCWILLGFWVFKWIVIVKFHMCCNLM